MATPLRSTKNKLEDDAKSFALGAEIASPDVAKTDDATRADLRRTDGHPQMDG